MDAKELLDRTVACGGVKFLRKKQEATRRATVVPFARGWVIDYLHTTPDEKSGSEVLGATRSVVFSGTEGENWVPAEDKVRAHVLPNGTAASPEAIRDYILNTGELWPELRPAPATSQIGIEVPEDFVHKTAWGSVEQAHKGDMLIVNADADGRAQMAKDEDGNSILDAWVVKRDLVNTIYEGPATEGFPPAPPAASVPYPTGVLVDIVKHPDGTETKVEVPNETIRQLLPDKDFKRLRAFDAAYASADQTSSALKEFVSYVGDGLSEELSDAPLKDPLGAYADWKKTAADKLKSMRASSPGTKDVLASELLLEDAEAMLDSAVLIKKCTPALRQEAKERAIASLQSSTPPEDLLEEDLEF